MNSSREYRYGLADPDGHLVIGRSLAHYRITAAIVFKQRQHVKSDLICYCGFGPRASLGYEASRNLVDSHRAST